METINIHAINKVRHETVIEVSLNAISRLTVLNAESIKNRLMHIISNRGTVLFLNVEDLRFVDSKGFDILNQLSRVARKYNSKLTLVNVDHELMELISLVKQYGIFDIDEVIPQINEDKVA